jgi:predicted RNase H-like HicB family nuclease
VGAVLSRMPHDVQVALVRRDGRWSAWLVADPRVSGQGDTYDEAVLNLLWMHAYLTEGRA